MITGPARTEEGLMAQASNRRKMPRLPNVCEIFARDGRKMVAGRSKDLSASGVGFFADRELKVGSRLDLCIFMTEPELNCEVAGVVRHCTLVAGNAQPDKFLVGIEFVRDREDLLPFIQTPNQHFSQSLVQTVVVETDLAVAAKLLTDISRFKEWVPELQSVRVLETYPDGRCKRAEFHHRFLVMELRYVGEYIYHDRKAEMIWNKVDGDPEIVSSSGRYMLKSLGPGKTAVTFNLNLTVSFVPASRLVNYLSTGFIRKALKNLKTFIENESP